MLTHACEQFTLLPICHGTRYRNTFVEKLWHVVWARFVNYPDMCDSTRSDMYPLPLTIAGASNVKPTRLKAQIISTAMPGQN